MPSNFLTPRIDLLSADGTYQTLYQGGTIGRILHRPVLLLSRDLCSFQHFSAGNIPSRRRRQAAQLQARASAPYLHSGSSLTKAGTDFGIWWWDAHRIEALINTAGLDNSKYLICPENLAQPAPLTRQDSWRIVRLSHGYEAQFWRDKALVATAWRLERYDAASWLGFVRIQRGQDTAPDIAPAPTSLAVHYDSRVINAPIELSREKLAVISGASTVLGSLCLAAYLSGQAWQLGKDTEVLISQTSQIRATTPTSDAVENIGEAQKTLLAYQNLENQTNPLSAAGAAIGILAYHEITPISLEAGTESLRFVISYNALNSVKAVVEDLQNSGYFYDVKPHTDTGSQSLTIEMKVHDAAPPLEAH